MEELVMIKQYKVAALGMACMLAAVTSQSIVPQEKTEKNDSNYTETVTSSQFDEVEETSTETVLLEKEEVTKQRVFLNESQMEEVESTTETEEVQPEIINGEEEASRLDGYVLPSVEEYLNIRFAPSKIGRAHV